VFVDLTMLIEKFNTRAISGRKFKNLNAAGIQNTYDEVSKL